MPAENMFVSSGFTVCSDYFGRFKSGTEGKTFSCVSPYYPHFKVLSFWKKKFWFTHIQFYDSSANTRGTSEV